MFEFLKKGLALWVGRDRGGGVSSASTRSTGGGLTAAAHLRGNKACTLMLMQRNYMGCIKFIFVTGVRPMAVFIPGGTFLTAVSSTTFFVCDFE